MNEERERQRQLLHRQYYASLTHFAIDRVAFYRDLTFQYDKALEMTITVELLDAKTRSKFVFENEEIQNLLHSTVTSGKVIVIIRYGEEELRLDRHYLLEQGELIQMHYLGSYMGHAIPFLDFKMRLVYHVHQALEIPVKDLPTWHKFV